MPGIGDSTAIWGLPDYLILNNGRYGTIRMHQERDFPGRVSGTDCWNPDFVALAQASGFMGKR